MPFRSRPKTNNDFRAFFSFSSFGRWQVLWEYSEATISYDTYLLGDIKLRSIFVHLAGGRIKDLTEFCPSTPSTESTKTEDLALHGSEPWTWWSRQPNDFMIWPGRAILSYIKPSVSIIQYSSTYFRTLKYVVHTLEMIFRTCKYVSNAHSICKIVHTLSEMILRTSRYVTNIHSIYVHRYMHNTGNRCTILACYVQRCTV